MNANDIRPTAPGALSRDVVISAAELQQLRQRVEGHDAALAAKDIELAAKDAQLADKDAQLTAVASELSSTTAEAQRLRFELDEQIDAQTQCAFHPSRERLTDTVVIARVGIRRAGLAPLDAPHQRPPRRRRWQRSTRGVSTHRVPGRPNSTQEGAATPTLGGYTIGGDWPADSGEN